VPREVYLVNASYKAVQWFYHEPFKQWLVQMVDTYGSPEKASAHIGITPRRIRALIDSSQQYIQLRVVDEALLHHGKFHIWDIYGDYPDRIFTLNGRPPGVGKAKTVVISGDRQL